MARTKKQAATKDDTVASTPEGVVKKSRGRPAEDGKRKKKGPQTWSVYIHRVLKQVHPDMRMKMASMSILDSFVNDIMERISAEASRLVKYRKVDTMSSRDVQTAARLILPGELAKHAVSEGTKSVAKFTAAAKAMKETE